LVSDELGDLSPTVLLARTAALVKQKSPDNRLNSGLTRRFSEHYPRKNQMFDFLDNHPVVPKPRRSMPMSRRVWLLLFFVVLSALQSVGIAQESDEVTLAIVGGRLINGHGSPPLENAVVLVSGERISSIGTKAGLAVPDGVPIVDAHGMTVMPGLIDMHVHFLVMGHNNYEFWFPFARTRAKRLMEVSAKILLDLGVTTVKDCSGPLPEIVNLRDGIERGEIPGPRAVITGPFLGHHVLPDRDYVYWAVDGVEDTRTKLQRLLDAEVNQIKVFQTSLLSPEERTLIFREAHRAGKHITCHVNNEDDIRTAIEAGMDRFDTLEHVGGGPGTRYSDEIVDLIVQSGVGVVPTVMASEGMSQLEKFPGFADIQSLKRNLPPDLYELVRGSYDNWRSDPLFHRGKYSRPGRRNKLRQLYEAGANLLMGTDSGTRGNPHELAAWREMEAMTEYGFSNMEAIVAATHRNAINLGLDKDIGAIEAGKIADIIVIDGDPLARITDVRLVAHVIQSGRVVR
jgi:imidazolonepropionase-like amidohydrolase